MKKRFLYLCIIMIAGLFMNSCKKLNPTAPVACFVVSAQLEAGIPIQFDAGCSENALTYLWSFGDGSTSVSSTPEHTYQAGGIYIVSLIISNSLGATDEATQTLTVAEAAYTEHKDDIESDETWEEGVHLVSSDIYIDGATLTIAPGSVVMFASGRGIYVGYHSGFSGATLIADGTASKPILFTSSAVTKSAGDWDYIGFYDAASSSSSFKFCTFEYGGGYSENYGELHIQESSVSIVNSSITNSESLGISMGDEGYFEAFTSNTFSDLASNPISMYANYVHTIGADNTFTSTRGILIKGDDLVRDNAIWLKQDVPYVISQDVYIESATAAKLTLMPGVEVQFGNGAGIYLGYHTGTYGTLIAEGTESEHIVFTSSAPEGSKAAGDWDYLGFYDGAGNSSSFDYCDLEYGGGYSDNYGMIHVEGSSISLTNSTVMNSEFVGVTMRDDGFFQDCSGNTFEGSSKYPIEIYGNWAHTVGVNNTYNTGPGIFVKGDDMVQTDVTWLKQGIPYILDGNHYIESSTGASLTIEPGTTVKFASGAQMYVGYHTGTFGTLVAIGTAELPVTFTSGAAEGFEAAGDWDGIWFYDGTGNGTELDHCIIQYGGGYSANSGNLNIMNETVGVPTISNCQIKFSAAWGIYLQNNAVPTLTDNTFTSNFSGATNQ